jgi:HSP20 family protein
MNLVPVERDLRPSRREGRFDTLQREIDRVFDGFARGWPAFDPSFFAGHRGYPSIDIAETESEIEVSCELPGIEQKDIEITLANDILTIRGEKRTEKHEKDKLYQQSERTYGAFSRSVAMPPGLDPDLVKASMNHGVLKVTAAKPKSAVAKHIEISPAGKG